MAKGALIVIVAQQRSGTTALAQTLATIPDICSFGEVFHSARSKKDHPQYEQLHISRSSNFFSYRESLFRVMPELSHPSEVNQSLILDGYLRHLNVQNREATVIDIKYNSWHHLEPEWSTPGEPPALMKALHQRGALFVHVRRRDLLARYVSERVAVAHKTFHALADLEVKPRPITISLSDAALNVERVRSLITTFERWLSPINRCVDLIYEEMFCNNQFSQESIEKFGQLGLDLARVARCPLRKLIPDPSLWVENWDEVVKAKNTLPDKWSLTN